MLGTRQLPLLALLTAAIGCGSGTPTTSPPPPPPVAATVTVAPTTLALVEGETGTLTATVKDASGATITANVTWSAAPAGVVTVSSSGRVTAVAAGSATITARAGTTMATATVIVSAIPVAAVTLTTPRSQLEIGEHTTVTAVTRSSTGGVLSGRLVTWMSSNPGAATVASTGVVTGVAPGDATITATSEGISATTAIHVDTRTAYLSALADSVRAAFNLPAMGVAIVTREEGVVGTGAAGRRRISSPVQVTVNDLWHIGSDLKAITGFTAAIAVGQGAISWNTTLAEAYPEFAATMLPEYRNVTLQMLLAHVGGIASNVQDPSIPGAGSLTTQRTNIAQWATSIPPAVPVGDFNYSNVGIMIAANMVERALGTSWESAFQSLFLGPLGITDFGWGPAPYDQNQNPIGHQWISGAWVENPGSDNPPYLSAAGRSHWSMAAWGRAIQEIMRADQGESTLVPQSVARVMTTAVSTDPPYGGGWFTWPQAWAVGRALTHDGSNNLNFARVDVALDRGAAVLAATNGADPSSTRVSDAMDVIMLQLWAYLDAHGP